MRLLVVTFNNPFSCNQVLCDRHYGGVRYPVGGVGGIARTLADGLEEAGGQIAYKANVKRILVEDGKAVREQYNHGAIYEGCMLEVCDYES
jgi:prolycopene isomerase